MSFFFCKNCNKKVLLDAPGTKNRNHCPYCLYSYHIDNQIGDRKSKCLGIMEPVAKIIRKSGEEVIVHKCLKCGIIRKNRIAGDDSFKVVAGLKVIEDF